ncbi:MULTISPECIES: RDD family protein [Marinobacter]|uniref:RDD family protein n=1 Tax=Marinobacter TaxID=2742 RepID=UPI000DABF68D|nr:MULTISPECIES: RDD family protein [Marinobacter]
MPQRFHATDELLPPASLVKRLLAMIYDGLICIAVLIVTSWAYTMLAAWVIGFEEYKALAESGRLSSDPLLTSVLFVTLFVFFGYFWTRTGQTLGMQVWRVRIENADGTSIRWYQALLRYLTGWLSWLIGGLGYLWMLWDSENRSWTDRASESRVVTVPRPSDRKA